MILAKILARIKLPAIEIVKRSKLKSNKESLVVSQLKNWVIILGPEYLQRRVPVSIIFRDESCGIQEEERKLVGQEEGR